MPVFLPFESAEARMRETPAAVQAMLDHFAIPQIAIYPITRRVNAPRDDDPALLEPVDLEFA